jgi:FkbM family methyltransferase
MENPMRKFTFRGHDFYFTKTPAIDALINEIFSDNYHVLQYGIQFGAGDIILDLGANEGVFSIMMAKLFPLVQIYSVEAISSTYKTLLSNIASNHTANINPWNCGVGGNTGQREFTVCNNFSGGSSSVMSIFDKHHHRKETVKIFSMQDLFNLLKVSHCKLLKIDIEGMEHEVLLNCTDFSRIDNMVAEIHINSHLQKSGYSTSKLVNYIRERTNLIHYETCQMAE